MKYRFAATAGLMLLSIAVKANVTVTGNTITWPGNGDYYQVQDQRTYKSICEGRSNSCVVSDGTYTVINHSRNSRTKDVVVPKPGLNTWPQFGTSPSSSSTNGITVRGDVITLPDDGDYYQVQRQGSTVNVTICEGTLSCKVSPGTYQVINLTTDVYTRDIEVPSTTAQDGTTPGLTPRVVVDRSTIWTINDIPVCWENPTPQDQDQRSWTRDAVYRTWEREGRLRFVGWNACTSGSMGIRILIDDSAPSVRVLGSRLNGMRNGMTLNFEFNTWGPSCANGGSLPAGFSRSGRIRSNSEEEFCIKAIAVHEFGHAVGIAHEHNRDDRSNCTKDPQGPIGNWMVTEYDPESIMNYCATFWTGSGNLSDLDKDGYRVLYGSDGANMTSAVNAQQVPAAPTSLYGTTKFGNVVSLQQLPFARGFTSDGSIWEPVNIGNNFEDGKRIVGDVVALSSQTGITSIFGLDVYGELLRIQEKNGTYTWDNLGNGFSGGKRFIGPLTVFESLVYRTGGSPGMRIPLPVFRTDIIGLDNKGNLMRAWSVDDNWNWEVLGNGFKTASKLNGYNNSPFAPGIKVVGSSPFDLHVMGLDESGNVAHFSLYGSKQSWVKYNSSETMQESFKGIRAPIALTSSQYNKLDFFGMNPNGSVRHVKIDVGNNSARATELGMEENGRQIVKSMSAVSVKNGKKLEVYGMDKKDRVLKLERLADGGWRWYKLGDR